MKEKNNECVKEYRGLRMTLLVIRRFFLFVLTFLLLCAGGMFAAAAMVCNGPSDAAKNILVMSCLETSALKFVPGLFFSSDEIADITAVNTVSAAVSDSSPKPIEINVPDADTDKPSENIELIDITGPTYKGKMLIVHDPSRVFVGSCDSYVQGGYGKKLAAFVEDNNAIAGVNAGGFADENGVGKGGEPIGIVISQGTLKWGSIDSVYGLIGFDNDNRFVIGQMSGKNALERGIRDAVTFGPFLIVNGEPANVLGTGGGLNPRTAIGQREDGAVLILVVDGRQPGSLGANYSDLVTIMSEYGAVNAANLDGGSSSQMIYNGESVTNCCSFYGARYLPTSILVR